MRKTLIATAAFLALGTVSALADCCPVDQSGRFSPTGSPIFGQESSRRMECAARVAKAKLSPKQIASWRAVPYGNVCPQIRGTTSITKYEL